MGFEPMNEFPRYPLSRRAPSADSAISPFNWSTKLAEGVGFEPTELLHSTVFKTAAFDHSAIPPRTVVFKLSFCILQVNAFVKRKTPDSVLTQLDHIVC